jgi:hypothetical protein
MRILNQKIGWRWRRYYLLLNLLLAGLLLPLPAYQQAPFVVCGDPTSGSDAPALGCRLTDLLEVPARIFNYLLGLAAFVLLGVIIFAGLRMMWFHLSESPQTELENAKNTLTRGIVGFVIVLGTILIVNILLQVLGVSSSSGLAGLLIGFGFTPN